MTQEDKEFLLRDLCARLPYHPKGRVVNAHTGAQCDEWLTCATFQMFTNIVNNSRLYLRPMSSMTEDEKKEYEKTCSDFYETLETYDWLNRHHFDYRGLIERGLSIAVTKQNNPYKD